MDTDLRKHILRYSLFIIISKSILSIIGTFIENQTMPMALLTLAYLSTFCSISIVMIRSFRRDSKLRLTEKLIAVLILFMVNEICGILIHNIYFVGILGQAPTTRQVLDKVIGILKFDSHILIIATIISVFINSKTDETDKTLESAN